MEAIKQRERIYSWGNPLEGVELSKNLSGLEYLLAIKRGEAPASPLMNTLEFSLGEIEEGKASFHFEPQEFHYNPNGSIPQWVAHFIRCYRKEWFIPPWN